MIDEKIPSPNAPSYSAQTWAVSTSSYSHLWYMTVNLGTKFAKSESNFVTWNKIIHYEAKEGKSGCRVPKNWIGDVVGFGQTGKHSWAVHFGKIGGAQFICLQWGGASNCMTGVVSRKKPVTISWYHRVEDPFGNREGIWKPGSEISIHSGSLESGWTNKSHSHFWHNRCMSTNNSPLKLPLQSLSLQSALGLLTSFLLESCTVLPSVPHTFLLLLPKLL